MHRNPMEFALESALGSARNKLSVLNKLFDWKSNQNIYQLLNFRHLTYSDFSVFHSVGSTLFEEG